MAFRSAKRYRRRPDLSQRRQKRIFYGLLATVSALAAFFAQTL